MTFKTLSLRSLSTFFVVAALLTSALPATAQLPTPPETKYLVAFTTLPTGLLLGGTWNGGVVYLIEPATGHIAVSSSDPDFKTNAYADSTVRYVELDEVGEFLLTPNDPQWTNQYGPAQVRLPNAWDQTTGTTDAAVCVLDTGVRRTHEDLTGSRWLGGRDAVNNDAEPEDTHGHGTQVTSAAAAGVNNAKGIAGAGNVGFYHVRIGVDAPSSSAVLAGVNWCADNTIGPTVISMSFRIGQSQSVTDAINRAYNTQGKLLVAAAGNNDCNGGGGNCIVYPANLDNVIAVTCTNRQVSLCSFSDSGPQAELAAPGDTIRMACRSSDTCYSDNSGTSFSAPLVAGVAALVWGAETSLTNTQLRTRLQQTAKDLGTSGRDSDFGFGRVDAFCAIRNTVPCQGGPPANDHFANARAFTTVPYSNSESINEASLEGGEKQPTCATVGPTIWYRYTPPGDGTATVNTFGSNFDTVLGVYTGSSMSNLVQVTCNDDTGGLQSEVSFSATRQTNYYIQVGGFNGADGNVQLSVSCSTCNTPPAPANDAFHNPITVNAMPSSFRQTTVGAGTQSGEPTNCNGVTMGSTVWYRWTATGSGTLTVDTFNSNYDTTLAAYTGSSVGALTQLACNDDSSGTAQSQISVTVTSGTVYQIQLGGFNGATGTDANIAFQFQCTSCTTTPANDNFDRPVVISSVPSSNSQSTAGATTQNGESLPCGSMGATVWYRWTPSNSGTATANTVNSDYDTVLAVYRGTSLSNLVREGCDDDGAGNRASTVSWNAVGGTTYYLQAGGFGSATGSLSLAVSCSSCNAPPPPTAPANDNRANAIVISSTPFSNTQNTAAATLESGERRPCGSIGATVWYRYTHPLVSLTTAKTATTSGSNFDTVLAVYVQLAPGVIEPVWCNDDASGATSSVTFTTLPGVTYWFQSGGFNGATGSLRTNLN